MVNKAASLEQIGAFLTMIQALFISLLTGKSKVSNRIDGDKLEKATNSPDFLDRLIEWINNGCKLTVQLVNGFVFGDMFKHRAEVGDKRLYFGDNYRNWCVTPWLKKFISIRELGRPNEYRLPKSMKDNEIQAATGNPGNIDFETYSILKYILIFQPELAEQFLGGYKLNKKEWYVMHVELPDGRVVAVNLYWRGDEWFFGAISLGDGTWFGGRLFLSFAAAKK